MKRGPVLVAIAIALVGVLTLAIVYPQPMVAPGALIPAHAGFATDCFACHAPFTGTSPERCLTCHVITDIGLKTTKGVPLARPTMKASFHRDLIETNCMACHSDHAGPMLTQRKRRPFSHELLRPAVRNRCEACHNAPKDDFHRNLTAGCALCHTQERWTPSSFDHAKYFVLDRDHKATCATCHRNNDTKRFTCYGCHEHRPEQVRAEHLEEGIRNFENCVRCHRSANEEPREGGSREGQERD